MSLLVVCILCIVFAVGYRTMLCYRMDGADPCDKTCAVTVVATPIVACVDRIDGYTVIFQVQDRVL